MAYPLAKTHQRLSGAVCGAFGSQAFGCAHRRLDPHSKGDAVALAICYVWTVSSTKHPLGACRQCSEAVLHGLIVHTAELIVPPMHRLRLVRKDIKNAKLAAQLFSNFLRLED